MASISAIRIVSSAPLYSRKLVSAITFVRQTRISPGSMYVCFSASVMRIRSRFARSSGVRTALLNVLLGLYQGCFSRYSWIDRSLKTRPCLPKTTPRSRAKSSAFSSSLSLAIRVFVSRDLAKLNLSKLLLLNSFQRAFRAAISTSCEYIQPATAIVKHTTKNIFLFISHLDVKERLLSHNLW